jgi:hypothetical protein
MQLVGVPGLRRNGFVYSNTEIALLGWHQELTIASGEQLVTPPLFYVFSDHVHRPEEWADLTKLTFQVDGQSG